MSMDTGTESEWCECNEVNPYRYLYESNGYCLEVMVHSSCGKPAFGVWQAHEQICQECGRSFSTPWEELCRTCIETFHNEEWFIEMYGSRSEPYRSWAWALLETSAWHAVLWTTDATGRHEAEEIPCVRVESMV